MSLNLREKPHIWISLIAVLVVSFSLYRIVLDKNGNDSVTFEFHNNGEKEWTAEKESEYDQKSFGIANEKIGEERFNHDSKEQMASKQLEEVTTYISGAVDEPGVYSLPDGSRIFQLIDKAGGETEDARLELLNLAAPLQDGEHIHVFREGDDMTAQEISKFGITNHGHSDEQLNKVNINTADSATLETLPSIGPVRAKNILKYREDKGYFRRIDQIMEVSGIGTGIYDQIKDLLVVD